MVATVLTPVDPHPLTGGPGKRGEHRRGNRLSRALKRGLGALGIDLGLIPGRLEAGDTLPQIGVFQIGYTALDGVVQLLEPDISLGGPLSEFADMMAAALGTFLAAIQDVGQNLFQPIGHKQAVRNVVGDNFIQLRHGDRPALAASLALPGLG